MSKKNKILIIIIISIVLVIALVGVGTYAWLNYRTNDITVAGNTACFEVNYTKGSDLTGTLSPVNEKTFLTNKSITINNSMAISSVSIELDDNCGDVNGLGTIELNVTSLSSTFKRLSDNAFALKYIIIEYDPSIDGEATISNMSGKTFDILKKGSIYYDGTTDLYSEYLKPGVVHNYMIIMYVDNELTETSIVGNIVSASVSARVEEFVPTPISDFEYYIGTYNSPGGAVTIPNDEVFLTKYNGSSPVVNIPSTYTINGNEYKTVLYAFASTSVSASKSVFRDNTVITNVNFADGVKFVINSTNGSTLIYNRMYYTFFGCSNLRSAVNLPDEITHFYFTFQNSTSLTSVSNIPSSLTYMHHAFYNCSSLIDEAIIPDGVTNLNSTFSNCTSLSSAPIIPSLVTDMNNAFNTCSALKGQVIVNSSSVSGVTNTFSATTNNITLEVPNGSTTYTKFNGNVPNNVTLVAR